MWKSLLSGATAIALATAPAAATAQSRPAPATQASEVQPGAEQAEGSELRRRGFILPLIGVVALIVLIYLLTRKDKDEAFPVSP